MEAKAGPRIPKILHYVWVGGKPLPPLARRCMASWEQYAPGYELRFWNEENIPMEHPYVRAMYRQRKWAFVSDYVRFWALAREGGIYLDTDMELLKPIDRFLADAAFFGRAKDGFVSSSIIGALPNHPLIASILKFYDHDTAFSIKDSSPKVVTRALEEYRGRDVLVYEPALFYPCNDGERCGPEARAGAYATHHWAESWVPYARVRKVLRRLGILKHLKRLRP